MKEPTSFRSRQIRYWQTRRLYRDPRHPTPRAFIEPKLEWASRYSTLGRTASVLDVGAGNGTATWSVGQRARFVVGIDESASALCHAPSGVRFVQGDALRLPFPDESFDVVLESNVLHHVDCPVEMLREMSRVARESVVVIEPNRWHIPMSLFMLAVRAENRGLRFTRRHVAKLAAAADLAVVALSAQGLVYETRTPAFVLPWLARFDRPGTLGAYVVGVLRKRAVDLEPF